MSIDEGKRAARQCFINVLAHLKASPAAAISTGCSRWCGSAASSPRRPEFTAHAQVMNGACDLAVAVFGDAGRHARTTVGVPSLPLDAAVEVEGMFRIA